jgi:hypothetical protein
MLTLTGVPSGPSPWAVVSTKKTGEVIPLALCSRSRASTTVASSSCSPSPCQTPSLLKRAVGRTGDRACPCLGSWRVSLPEGARCEMGDAAMAAACGWGMGEARTLGRWRRL